MLQTTAVRKMLAAARAELRQQRFDAWDEASDPAVPSVAVLIEIKGNPQEHGGYHGFSLRTDSAKYDQAFERLQAVIGAAIQPPDPESSGPPIPVTIMRGETGRDVFDNLSHHAYPRYGSERLLQATIESQQEADSRVSPGINVKFDYQLPDNLAFTGEHLHHRKGGVQACRLGACEVYLITCQDVPPIHESDAHPGMAPPALEPYYSLHSKLWTRRFPNAENVLKRCQQHLMPVFHRHDADTILRNLLKRTEKLHGMASSDVKLTKEPDEIRKQAASLAAAVAEIDAALECHVAHASTFVIEWAEKVLDALKGLLAVMETAERHFDSRAFDLESSE